MGRTEKSQGLAPPAVRKDIRAKQARHIVNKVVPAILASNSRARKGSEASELVIDPLPACVTQGTSVGRADDDVVYVKRKGQGKRRAKNEDVENGTAVDSQESRKVKGAGKGKRATSSIEEDISQLALSSEPKPERRVRVVMTDSLTVARMFQDSRPSKKSGKVCILNMASPLRPGGGVLAGATSQEEFLCARTTLLPSLKEEYYRLPELGGIWTPDVLVFRNSASLGDAKGELGPSDRQWVDVISAGMLRFPELEGDDDEIKSLCKKDRDIVESKMRAVLRIAERKGVKKLVLGAWGCGAYGNPIHDIAHIWKKVIDPPVGSASKKGKRVSEAEQWPNLEEVIFAIANRKMARDFAQEYGGRLEVEPGPNSIGEDEEEDEQDQVAEELRTKISEMESQLSKVWNPDLKSRMGVILGGLKAQLKEREDQMDDDLDEEEEDSSSTQDRQFTPSGSDMEDDSEDDIDHDSDDTNSIDEQAQSKSKAA